MASMRYCPSCLSATTSFALARTRPATHTVAPLLPITALRHATQSTNALKYKRKDVPASQKKRKQRTSYETPDLKNALQFSLVDAMRYLRAAEVGRPPTSAKYELHVRLRTAKNGAVVRNRLRLPHPVKTDMKICVICPPDSKQAQAAIAAGASIVGEQSVFDAVKEGRIDFERCLCHTDSSAALQKAGIARILGPRGLMPSVKTGTVTGDVANLVREMVGGSEYRERLGVVRLAIGQLGFTPEQLQQNIRTFMETIRKDIADLSDRISKDVHEVVLSSTNGPGLTLNGEFRGPASIPANDLGPATN